MLTKSTRRLLILFLMTLTVPSFSQTGVSPGRYKPHFLRNTSETSPISIDICRPEYPRASLRNEETGITEVEFKTEETGRLLDLRVSRSSGFRGLDNAVLLALQNCRFKPASINGKAVQGHAVMQYVWRLD